LNSRGAKATVAKVMHRRKYAETHPEVLYFQKAEKRKQGVWFAGVVPRGFFDTASRPGPPPSRFCVTSEQVLKKW